MFNKVELALLEATVVVGFVVVDIGASVRRSSGRRSGGRLLAMT